MAKEKKKADGPKLRLVKPTSSAAKDVGNGADKQRTAPAPRKLYLNPYEDLAFTRCPACDEKTKVRKFPLAVFIEPANMLFVNISCRLCEPCSLLIVRQSELEHLMVTAYEERDPDLIGNEYMVVGTMPRKMWRDGFKGVAPFDSLPDAIDVFEDELDFDFVGGWTLDPE